MTNPQPIIKNLVFGGGGIKLLTTLGALQEVIKKKYIDEQNIERVAGSSAGAIAATFMAIGIPVAQVQQIILDFDFKAFIPKQYKVSSLYNLYTNAGIVHTKNAEYILEKFIYEKTGVKNLTFTKLHEMRIKEIKEQGYSRYLDLYVTVTNLTTLQNIIISHEKKSPIKEIPSNELGADTSISKILAISMSVPLLFIPAQVGKYKLADGDLMKGYPINAFDKRKYLFGNDDPHPNKEVVNHQTLGFRIGTDLSKFNIEINGLTDKIKSLATMVSFLQSYNAELSEKIEKTHRTITTYTDLDTVQFDIPNEKKIEAIESGKWYASLFLHKFHEESELFKPVFNMKRSSSLPEINNLRKESSYSFCNIRKETDKKARIMFHRSETENAESIYNENILKNKL